MQDVFFAKISLFCLCKCTLYKDVQTEKKKDKILIKKMPNLGVDCSMKAIWLMEVK